MPNVTSEKQKRKNMNLTEERFLMLERLKKQEEKKVGVPLAWDSFFKRSFEELVRLRRELAQAAERGQA